MHRYLGGPQQDLPLLLVFPLLLDALQLLEEPELRANVRRLLVALFVLRKTGEELLTGCGPERRERGPAPQVCVLALPPLARCWAMTETLSSSERSRDSVA